MFGKTDLFFFLACSILLYLTFLQSAILFCPQSSLCSAVLLQLNSSPRYWHKFSNPSTESIKSHLFSSLAFCFPICASIYCYSAGFVLYSGSFGFPHLHGIIGKEHNIQRYHKKAFCAPGDILCFLNKALETLQKKLHE